MDGPEASEYPELYYYLKSDCSDSFPPSIPADITYSLENGSVNQVLVVQGKQTDDINGHICDLCGYDPMAPWDYETDKIDDMKSGASCFVGWR